MRWIETYGGNLMCLEKILLKHWKGNEGSSIGGQETDYERAGKSLTYTSCIPTGGGKGLVISSGPQEASVWKGPCGHTHIVTVECSDDDLNEPDILRLIPTSFFQEAHTTHFLVHTRDMILFDTVDVGDDVLHVNIDFAIDPGRYEIRSKPFSPTSAASFILHRFQRTNPP